MNQEIDYVDGVSRKHMRRHSSIRILMLALMPLVVAFSASSQIESNISYASAIGSDMVATVDYHR